MSLTSRSRTAQHHPRNERQKKIIYSEKNNIDNDEGVQDDSEPRRTSNEDGRAPLRRTYPSAVLRNAPFATPGRPTFRRSIRKFTMAINIGCNGPRLRRTMRVFAETSSAPENCDSSRIIIISGFLLLKVLDCLPSRISCASLWNFVRFQGDPVTEMRVRRVFVGFIYGSGCVNCLVSPILGFDRKNALLLEFVWSVAKLRFFLESTL